MDVDLLRPGTVPISSDTVLWFEFLLDPDLLLKHLEKPNSDPSPTELITKFYDVVLETARNLLDNPESEVISVDVPPTIKPFKDPAKNVALKILCLKVLAYLKWNMGSIGALPIHTQIHLLLNFVYFTNGNSLKIPCAETPDLDTTLNSEFLFALVIKHRWLLYSMMHKVTSSWQMRVEINELPLREDIVTFLTNSLKWTKIPNFLTFDCFKLPTETNDNTKFDWSQSVALSKEEYFTQINFDLGMFFFFKEQYDLAKQHFTECLQIFETLQPPLLGFCDVDKEVLEVYLKACGEKLDVRQGSLLDQLNSSIFNQYVGIANILQQDNIQREIPLSHRLNLELNIQGALSSGTFTVAKDLLDSVQALNVVRCILDQKPLYQYSNSFKKQIDTLLWAIKIGWTSFPNQDKALVKSFLLELLVKNEIPDLLARIEAIKELSSLFDQGDLSYVKHTEKEVKIPESLLRNFTPLIDFTKKRKAALELKRCEHQLITSFDHMEIRKVLEKIAKISSKTAVSKINSQWELHSSLQNGLKVLPRGLAQDFAFVLLVKSKEQLANRNWNSALELLIILDKELQPSLSTAKLCKLISWEILLIKINQLLIEWPSNSMDKQSLANACEACLQTSDAVMARSEITDQCLIALLNLRHWDFLISFDKRWSSAEICSAIALACQEITSNNTYKKASKNLWDLVLPVFVTSSKRSNSGSTVRNNLTSVFNKIRDPMALAVIISLLAKMFNILKDEPGLELQIEYLNMWPAVISNANSYNANTVHEFLSEIVLQALSVNPTHVIWLRIMGDINFANSHYRTALSYYLKALLICNDYFNIPVRNDDHVFWPMIKCCTALGCHTQAAVLCQFLEEPDYTSAFRILGDHQKTCNDAVDAYYHCFWDTNILEYLIYIHNKKGEFQRRKCAVQVIGLLELNSNNNEEIQREAINLRKSTFLRALCKQFVF